MNALWLRRLALLAALVAFAIIVQHVLTLPASVAVDPDTRWRASHGETMQLAGLTGPIFAIQSAAGKRVSVSVPAGRLDADSIEGLADFKVKAPAAPTRLHWRSADEGDTRANLVATAHGSTPVTLELAASVDPEDPEIQGRVTQGALLIEAVGLVTETVGQPSELRANGQLLFSSDFGALPLGIIVPAGQDFSIALQDRGDGARFRIGAPEQRGLALNALSIRRADLSTRHHLCSAKRAGVLSWFEREPLDLTCRETLSASQLRLAGEAELSLSGNAFVVENGELRKSSWSSWLRENFVVVGVLAFILQELLKRGYAAWFGEATPSKPKPARRRRRSPKRPIETPPA